jgi:hypothetical protein
VDALSGNPATVANVSVHVSDTEASVHVRTLDAVGAVIHECENVFTGCPFVVASTPASVDLVFPGGGIAKVEFIDKDSAGGADGFTLDDLAFDLIPRVQEVSIDIKPGSFPNSINLFSEGTVPIAILSSQTFDARTVDPTTVTLASAAVRLRGNGTPQASQQDVNGDGLTDLVVHVITNQLELTLGDAQAELRGRTFSGQSIRGTDSVRVVRDGC